MDAGQLHMLARTLRQIATDATSNPDENISGAELLVGTDLFLHAPTTVGAIAARTGVAQSQVSKAIGEMRHEGVVISSPDPDDKRRTLLHVTPQARERFGVARGARTPALEIKAFLENAGRPAADRDVETILDLLEQLSTRLGGGNRPH